MNDIVFKIKIVCLFFFQCPLVIQSSFGRMRVNYSCVLVHSSDTNLTLSLLNGRTSPEFLSQIYKYTFVFSAHLTLDTHSLVGYSWNFRTFIAYPLFEFGS